MKECALLPSGLSGWVQGYVRARRFGLFGSGSKGSDRDTVIWPWTPSYCHAEDVRRAEAALRAAGVNDTGGISAVSHASARRPVLICTRSDGRCLILKFSDADDAARAADENEYLMLSLLGARTKMSGAGVPRPITYDADQRLIVLEGVSQTRTYRDAVVHGDEPTPESLVRLAAVLAGVHGIDASDLRTRHPDRKLFLPVQSMLDITPTELSIGPGIQYATFVEAMQAVDGSMRGLIDAWSPKSLIHFDVRDDNVLIDAESGKVLLIDWELAGFGDPLYDVGAFVGQLVYHSLGLRTISIGAGSLASRWTRTFTGAYKSLADFDEEAADRVVRYAGLFLLLRALATLQVSGSLGPTGHLSVMLGRRFLNQPDLVIPELLG